MLPRSTFSLVSSLLLLVCLWTGTTAIGTTLTVNLTDDEARNKEFRGAPPVCQVTFIIPSDYSSRNQMQCVVSSDVTKNCTVTRGDSDSVNATFEREEDSGVMTFITFSITFDSTRVIGCSRYIPNVPFAGSGSIPIPCTPVFACNSTLSDSAVDGVQWWRFANSTQHEEFLNATDKSEFSLFRVMHENSTLQIGDKTLEIFFTTAIRQVVGYFATTFQLSGDEGEVNGESFIVYANPESQTSSGDQEVIFGSSETRYVCMYRAVWNSYTRAHARKRAHTRTMLVQEFQKTFLPFHLLPSFHCDVGPPKRQQLHYC
jgi:hypothetical protein